MRLTGGRTHIIRPRKKNILNKNKHFKCTQAERNTIKINKNTKTKKKKRKIVLNCPRPECLWLEPKNICPLKISYYCYNLARITFILYIFIVFDICGVSAKWSIFLLVHITAIFLTSIFSFHLLFENFVIVCSCSVSNTHTL